MCWGSFLLLVIITLFCSGTPTTQNGTQNEKWKQTLWRPRVPSVPSSFTKRRMVPHDLIFPLLKTRISRSPSSRKLFLFPLRVRKSKYWLVPIDSSTVTVQRFEPWGHSIRCTWTDTPNGPRVIVTLFSFTLSFPETERWFVILNKEVYLSDRSLFSRNTKGTRPGRQTPDPWTDPLPNRRRQRSFPSRSVVLSQS